ncbi:hypothetical protein INT45_003141 [Circinella minor]|uniref:Uncharacterized protein n=1 Tax=Circinella minor TaxID=1195481 RepID=A0A8H7RYF0_9FUNG|nr:hypothetical protein INT45_003141 [Circinella minor]
MATDMSDESPETHEKKCYDKIENYIREQQNVGRDICFAHFIRDERAFVAENSLPVADYKAFWSRLFGKVVNKFNIETVRVRADWKYVVAKISGEDRSSNLTSSTSSFKKPIENSRKRNFSSPSSSSTSTSNNNFDSTSSNNRTIGSSSTESTTKRRKKITAALTEGVEKVVLEPSTEKWFVGNVPVTERLLEFRELCIKKGKKGMLETYQEELSINGIFLIDGLDCVYPSSKLEYDLDEETWSLMIEECAARYPTEELNEETSKILRNFEKAGQTNFTLCSKIADGLESEMIKESLRNMYAVYPIILPFTKETDKTIRKGTDGQAQGSKDLKFSDLSINFKYGTMPEQGLVITEIKPPAKVKSGSRPDLVKLGNEMKDAIDKIVIDGFDNKDISVLGILIEGFRCTLFGMDLTYQATYRLVPISVFFIPQDRHDFARLPNCFSAISTMRYSP